MPTAIKRLVGELGLRFRPAAQADLEAHAASLALLATDLADIPPALLERAIREHVSVSPYMPKAADLIAKARGYLQREPAGGKVDRDTRANAERLAEEANAHLKGQGNWNIRWAVDEQNALRLEPIT